MVYMGLLLALGILSSRLFRGTSKDYFVASQSIGSFMLLMSVFGTTMTGFALVGSSGKAFSQGIGYRGERERDTEREGERQTTAESPPL